MESLFAVSKSHHDVAGRRVKSPVRSYVAALFQATRWKIAMALILTAFLSLTEGIWLLMLVPIMQLVGLDTQTGTVGQLARFVSSIFAVVDVHLTLNTALVLFLLVITVNALLFRWQTTINFAIQQEFVVHLRQRLYRAIANSNWLLFSRTKSSDFTVVLTAEIDRVGAAAQMLLHLIVNSIVAAVYLALALQLSGIIAGLVFAVGAGLLVLLKGKRRPSRLTGEALSFALNGLYAATIEHLGGMKTAKSYGVEERNVEDFSQLTKRVAKMYADAVRNQAEAKCWFDIGSMWILNITLVVLVQILSVPSAGVLLLVFLFARVMPRLSAIQQTYQQFQNMLPAFATVTEVQARCEAAAEPKPARSEQIELRDSIRLERVSFSYEERGDHPVISDLDLVIRAGQTTAIVGPSGAGKSTVADLVIGLIVPNRGRVLVDEVPLRAERMRAWREQIGYVPQETFLFHDTIRANLLWARPDATDEEIREALRQAVVDDFISRLPEGMETIIGDRGVRLSGGERQRLALARALLRRPAVLILDEATSNLDSENENRIQGAIDELHGRITILIITHRLSTVRQADTIHVLAQGHLVESGDWESLMANEENTRFRSLCRAQRLNGVDAQGLLVPK